MIWFQLILVTQLLIILSSTAKAARLRSNKDGTQGSNYSRIQVNGKGHVKKHDCPHIDNTTYPPEGFLFNGAMLLHYNREIVPICSGVLLKPWISLVLASCVHGRDVKRLSVELQIYNNTDRPEEMAVPVNQVITDPMYVPQQQKNNFAILLTYSQKNWDVREFLLPERHYIPIIINAENLLTDVNLWDTDDHQFYFPKQILVNVRNNLIGCKTDPERDGLKTYCVINCVSIPYNPVDFGSLLFIRDAKTKNRTLLGLYSNLTIQTPPETHLYLSIWPSINWIRATVLDHPVPPECSCCSSTLKTWAYRFPKKLKK